MKKNYLPLIAFGIGAFAFYSILLDIDFLKKAVSLWYMHDNKGMQMLLVGKGNSAPIFSLFLVIIEVSFFPIHSIFMFQVVNDLYGWIIGFFFASLGILICTLPLFIVSKLLVVGELKPFVLIIFTIISFFILPVPGIMLILIYFYKSYVSEFHNTINLATSSYIKLKMF